MVRMFELARNKPLVEGMGKEINKQSVFINLSRLSDSTKPFAFKVVFCLFLFCFASPMRERLRKEIIIHKINIKIRNFSVRFYSFVYLYYQQQSTFSGYNSFPRLSNKVWQFA